MSRDDCMVTRTDRPKDFEIAVWSGRWLTQITGQAFCQRALMRAEAGWPGTLKRLPVSTTSLPSTFRMEKSWLR